MLRAMFEEGAWAAAVDEVWPPHLRVGRGSATLLAGWIFHRRSPVVSLDLTMGGEVLPIATLGIPRPDVYTSLRRPDDEPPAATYTSGFWAVVPLHGTEQPEATPCALRARTAAGAEWRIELPTIVRAPERADPSDRRDPKLVSVCMATYDPDLQLFQRQVDSIKAQSHESWRCIITDDCSRPDVVNAMERIIAGDPRFELHREQRRLGTYFNFERALARSAPGAGLVALADQDDEWHPDKLARLIAALGAHHVLAYSDQRLVRPDRSVVSETFWVGRRNQWRDLRTLLLSNTVTGAATLFRRELLDRVLPFPPRLSGMYHDHWIALVARVSGSLAYVDAPLYDYIQHPRQTLGHPAAKEQHEQAHDDGFRHSLERKTLLRWQRHYFERLVPMQLRATAVLERFGGELAGPDRATLQRAAAADQSWNGVLALLEAVPARRSGPTLGYGRDAVLGACWRRLVTFRASHGKRPYADGRHGVWGPSLAVDYGPDAPAVETSRPAA